MEAQKHTPGEWKVEPTKGWYAIIGNGSRVATVESRFADFSDEAGANAHLIAAAPDLLATLKESQKAIDELMVEFISKKRPANWGVINDAGVMAGKAIAKAESSS